MFVILKNKMSIRSFIFTLFISYSCFSQGVYQIKSSSKSSKINFKLINNLIIIPVEVNNIELFFLLDTGVRRPIIFNFIKNSDSLKVINAEKIFLKGLGNDGLVEALKSSRNKFKIGEAVNYDQLFYAIFNSSINFIPKLGFPIHGIIGYDFFKDFVVEINYTKRFIKLTKHENYNSKVCKKCELFNIEFHNDKPYINAQAIIGGKEIPVKLLVDSGSSDSLWLFENDSIGLKVGAHYFKDFLGYGLSGSVYGKRSKIDAFKLKSFIIESPKVAFPDSTIVANFKNIKNRNGSLGGELLKRFNVIVDYKQAKLILKKNNRFNDAFEYNKSGMEIEHAGIKLVTEKDLDGVSNGYGNTTKSSAIRIDAIYAPKTKLVVKPIFNIANIRPNSPAERAGLRKGDIIISVGANNLSSAKSSLQNVIEKFQGQDGKKINMVVERYGLKIKVAIILESPFNN